MTINLLVCACPGNIESDGRKKIRMWKKVKEEEGFAH